MEQVFLTRSLSHIFVKSPYYPTFIEDARKLNGKFADGVWKFDARDEEQVKKICLENYGEDGSPTEYVTLELDLDYYSVGRGSEDYFAGKQILKRYARDEAVKLGEGVVITAGGFYPSGGSKKNPAIGSPRNNTKLEVRDVPLHLASRCAKHRGVSIVNRPWPKPKFTALVPGVLTDPEGNVSKVEAKMSVYEDGRINTALEPYSGPPYVPSFAVTLATFGETPSSPDRSFEGKFFPVSPDRAPTVEETQRMFAAKDEARFQREAREREVKEKEQDREKVKGLQGALSYCEFSAVHILMNESQTQLEQNLAAIESGDVSQDAEVITVIVSELTEIKELAHKLILAISFAGDKIPGERCGTCYGCQEDALEQQDPGVEEENEEGDLEIEG